MAKKLPPSKVSGRMYSERFSNPPKAPGTKPKMPAPAPVKPKKII